MAQISHMVILSEFVSPGKLWDGWQYGEWEVLGSTPSLRAFFIHFPSVSSIPPRSSRHQAGRPHEPQTQGLAADGRFCRDPSGTLPRSDEQSAAAGIHQT